MSTLPADNPLRSNPVFWLIWVLLGGAVVGGLTTVFIAFRSADHVLPEAWHWEGAHLDRDFELARKAAALGIEVHFTRAAGECRAIVRSAPDDPDTLTLIFAHGVDPSLDRVLLLRRAGTGDYRAACPEIPAGRWRVALETGQWGIRAQFNSSADDLVLRARDPGGP